MVLKSWIHLIFTEEYEFLPDLKRIVLFLELPAALILPFSRIFIPLIESESNINL
jgi:hypothetical protein